MRLRRSDNLRLRRGTPAATVPGPTSYFTDKAAPTMVINIDGPIDVDKVKAQIQQAVKATGPTVMPANPVADAARNAIRTLVPILPLVGSPKQGYRTAHNTYLRGSYAEILEACQAIIQLHETLR